MLKKIAFSLFLVGFVFSGVGFVGIQGAHAQAAANIPGCSSNVGYSITTGVPCNGTSSATMNIPGCSSNIGYSVITGVPCNGTSSATLDIPGCTSIYGYSTVTGVPCNGTSTATINSNNGTTTTTTPGLPVTGSGDVLLKIILLLSSGAIVFLGSAYLIKRYYETKS